MRYRLRHYIAYALVSASLQLIGLAVPASSQADDGCAPGMYFNWETNQCEYYDDLTVYVDPCCYIPGPAGVGPVGPGPIGPGPIGPGPIGPGPIGPGPVGPGPILPRR